MNEQNNSVVEKSMIHKDVEYKYSSDWIHYLESQDHWKLYWQQQKIMQNFVKPGDKVLEIGVGSGFTANYLRSKGVNVTTIDIDADKKPDILANIVSYDFEEQYDHVLAFEVFEHIPFSEFKLILEKISQICKSNLFVSLPRNEKVWFHCQFKIPKLRKINWDIATKRYKITEEHHFWEVDYGDTTKAIVEKEFSNNNFEIINQEKVLSKLFYTLKIKN